MVFTNNNKNFFFCVFTLYTGSHETPLKKIVFFSANANCVRETFFFSLSVRTQSMLYGDLLLFIRFDYIRVRARSFCFNLSRFYALLLCCDSVFLLCQCFRTHQRMILFLNTTFDTPSTKHIQRVKSFFGFCAL